jgi:hypothetical protein
MDDAIANLVLRGITVHRLVSGDPGCQSADVHDNAVHMEVSVDNRSATHDVYLFRWRRAAEFQAGVGTFQDCLAEYEAAHPGTTITALEVAPWRAYGPGWPPDLEARLRDALVEASRV